MSPTSTTPLTTAALFQHDNIIVWEFDRYTTPERYLADGHITPAEAADRLHTMAGPRRTVLSTRQAWATFTRHNPETCFLAAEETRDPSFDTEMGYDLCSCEAYDADGKRVPAVARPAANASAGALPVTWIEAEPDH